MIYELNHVGIVIRNLEKSLAFYEGALGAKVVSQNIIPSSQTDVVYLQITGGMVELLHRREPAANEVYGITHIGFMTDDLDGDFRALVDAGVKPLVQPKVAGSGVGRIAFVADPNGARVELLQRQPDYRTPPVPNGLIKSFDHYSMAADDLEAAKAFYGRRLGMKTLRTMRVESRRLDMEYLHYDYDVLELLHRPEPQRGPIFGHVALRVESVERALAHLKAKGVAAEAGSPKRAGTGLGLVGIVPDPDGVRVELVDRGDLRAL